MKFTNQRGSLLIEVLISITIAVVFSLAISSLVSANNKLVTISEQETQATALAKESVEQIFAIKQNDWSQISSLEDGNYIVEISGDDYVILPDNSEDPGELVDNLYKRKIVIKKVRRNEIGEISAAGHLDNQTRFVEVSVTWEYKGQQKRIVLQNIITNWKGGI